VSAPWWYSGEPRADGPADGATDEARPRFDFAGLAGLASGAQQLVDLARQAILTPHVGHEDPHGHPDCVICRALAAFGDASPGEAGSAGAGDAAIVWIDLEPPRR